MKTLAELTAYIEGRFPVGEEMGSTGLPPYLAPTGEPYVEVGHQSVGVPKILGTVDEGAGCEWAFDEETACWSARSAFDAYAEDRIGKLYWRVRPELGRRIQWHGEKETMYPPPNWGIYMRLLISDKPLSYSKIAAA